MKAVTNPKKIVEEIAAKAKKASFSLAKANTASKNKALELIQKDLILKANEILSANQVDVNNAKKSGASSSLIDRLRLTKEHIESMSSAINDIINLPDPVGEITRMWRRPNGLWVGRMRIPIGVIAIIYEARPNVTSDAAALCIKSGNSVILKGGSEAINTNMVIASIIKNSMKMAGLPENAVQVIPTTDREAVLHMLKLEEYIDLIIPRGGESLIRFVTENSRIPVIKHYKGVCHIYVDEHADLNKAVPITVNAKVQRPSVCNAVETLLVHEKIAKKFLPLIWNEFKKYKVEIRGCRRTAGILKGIKLATEEDWYTEYLDLIISVKIVKDINEAISHIEKYGSSHTESIITENYSNAMKFIREVNSSSVMVNASTRFSDGNQYGLGAEMGISTTRLHAYGPMGLEGLTIEKFIVFGEGQIRER